ncbi:MAG: ABC transporter permease [bacterium]|nr:ABC transporter permease [bacterium]
MRPLLALWKKELLQMIRDPAMLRVLIAAPIIQLLILSYAINTELKQMRVAIVNYDQSNESRRFIEKLFATDYFVPVSIYISSYSSAIQAFMQSEAEMVIILPENFSQPQNENQNIQIIVDGQHSNVASLGLGYLQRMVAQYNLQRIEQMKLDGKLPFSIYQTIEPVVRVWYNPNLDPKWFFVPGICVLLITIIATLLSGIAIVKEREIGTIELLLVAPIRRWQLIIGKIVPFYFLSLLLLGLAFIVGLLWFRVPFIGSWFDIWLGVTLYLFFLLSLGLFISTLSKTQAQAMFLVWFILIFSILTSGFFFPVENMPKWLQTMTIVNPMKYMMIIVRCVMLKGASWIELWDNYIMLAGLGLITAIAAIFRYQQKLN